jgi:acid phosphatase (class A)
LPLAAAALAQAEQNSAADTPSAANVLPSRFVRVEAFDFARILPPPPAPDSLAGRADLDAVLQAQAWRTPEQVDWARLVDKKLRGVFIGAYGEILGSWFAPEKFPDIVALTNEIVNDVVPLELAAKKVYPRLRPFAADPRVHPCVDRSPTGSYPSGHTAFAFVWAATMAEIFPERGAEFFERAHRIAWGRVIGGAHFPTDLEGGQVLATAIMAEMNKSEAFQKAVEKCRAEAKPFHGAGAVSWPQPAAMSMPRRWRTVLGMANSSARIFWNRRAASLCPGRPV